MPTVERFKEPEVVPRKNPATICELLATFKCNEVLRWFYPSNDLNPCNDLTSLATVGMPSRLREQLHCSWRQLF